MTLPQPTLTTDRLVLRPFSMADADAVFRIAGNKAIAATTRSLPHPYSLEMAKSWIEPQAENWQLGQAAVFAICRIAPGPSEPDSAPVVGAVGFEIHSDDANAELGYWVDQRYWGQGIATEAAGRTIGFAFQHFGLHRIYAYHLRRNPASGRVLEKLGMQKEGVLQEHVKKWGKFEDTVCYGILAKNYSG